MKPALLFALFTAFSTLAYGNGCIDPCKLPQPEPCPCDHGKAFNQGDAICAEDMLGIYNAPARFDTCGSWDIFFVGTFIYWEMKQQGMDVVRDESIVDPEYPVADAKMIRAKSGYTPGFKLGLGMGLEKFDNWTLFTEYTRLHGDSSQFTKQHRNEAMRNPTDHLYPLWIDTVTEDIPDLYKETSKWNWKIDLGDFEIGRPYYLGTRLTMTPFGGVRGGRFDQNFNVFYYYYLNTPYVDFSLNKQDTWLLGPRFGFDTNWILGKGVKIFTNFATSFLYQHYAASTKQAHGEIKKDKNHQEFVVTSSKSRLKEKNYQLTPNLELGLGLAWGTYFDHHNWHFDLLVSYDFQIFWNQNLMRALNESSYVFRKMPDGIPFHLTDSNPGDLILHGLTIGARFDF